MVDSWKLFKVVTLMVAWYITSIAAGVYNKEFLNLYELPMVLTLCQSFAGVVFGLVVLSSMGQLQFLQSMYELSTLGLLGAVHVVGTVLTNISTGKSSASFTHTVKASEPLFAVFTSFIVLKTRPSRLELSSLLVTTAGLVIACSSEFNFQMVGFLTALLSNVVFSTRSIFSKKLFSESKLDHQNVFLYISLISCNLVILPVIWETAYVGIDFIGKAISPGSHSFWVLLQASVAHYLYNMLSFLLLHEISPVSHSVWGSFKRLFIIYYSVWYFGNHYSLWNNLASLVAVVGVTMYSFSGSKPSSTANSKKLDDLHDGGTTQPVTSTPSENSLV